MKIYSKYDPPPHEGVICNEPTLTQQHFAEECDINNILDRYASTGLMPEKTGAFYADFTDVMDYRSTLDFLREAQDSFQTLPAITRAHFNNDPGELIDFVSRPENAPRFHEFGLTVNKDSSSLDVTVRTDTVSPQPLSQGDTK